MLFPLREREREREREMYIFKCPNSNVPKCNADVENIFFQFTFTYCPISNRLDNRFTCYFKQWFIYVFWLKISKQTNLSLLAPLPRSELFQQDVYFKTPGR